MAFAQVRGAGCLISYQGARLEQAGRRVGGAKVQRLRERDQLREALARAQAQPQALQRARAALRGRTRAAARARAHLGRQRRQPLLLLQDGAPMSQLQRLYHICTIHNSKFPQFCGACLYVTSYMMSDTIVSWII